MKCNNCGHENKVDARFCSKCGIGIYGDEADPFVGRRVDKYILRRRIGGGGSGSVYEGEHVDLGKRFAIKVLHADLVSDEESTARFYREARVLGQIEHENIVLVTDFGQVNGIGPYMVTEWLDGETLFGVRKKRGRLEVAEVLEIFDQLTDALDKAHSQGVIHRDLKPENMMIVRGSKGRTILKIVDFGIALLKEMDDRKLTAVGIVVGTPHYMAPEQIVLDAPVDHRADLYACGAILFELLTGRPPFFGSPRPVEVMEHHLRKPPPLLSDVAPALSFPPTLEAVVAKSLAKNPADRFQSGRELYDALAHAVVTPLDDDETMVSGEMAWDDDDETMTDLEVRQALLDDDELLAEEGASAEVVMIDQGAQPLGDKDDLESFALEDEEELSQELLRDDEESTQRLTGPPSLGISTPEEGPSSPLPSPLPDSPSPSPLPVAPLPSPFPDSPSPSPLPSSLPPLSLLNKDSTADPGTVEETPRIGSMGEENDEEICEEEGRRWLLWLIGLGAGVATVVLVYLLFQALR